MTPIQQAARETAEMMLTESIEIYKSRSVWCPRTEEIDKMAELLLRYRNSVIEECAKEMEVLVHPACSFAKSIRELKEQGGIK